MSETAQIARKFEALVTQILSAHGYGPMLSGFSADTGFDLHGTHNGQKWIATLKYYRSPVAQLSMVRAAALSVSHAALALENTTPIVVVSCRVPDAARTAIEKTIGVLILDRARLFALATTAKSPRLYDELAAILEINSDDVIDGLQYDVTGAEFDLAFEGNREAGVASEEIDVTGDDLASELAALAPGKETAADYERLSEKILRYLFPHSLAGWHRQQRTDDGLNQFDLICRIRPKQDFWEFLTDHLNSRYILFEFKNYSEEIGQGQVLTTEKYLLERGLRRVAILLTRHGASDSAKKAAQGAMREHGKLILVLGDQTVVDMLHLRQTGADPSDRLFDIADQFLLTLPR